MSLSNEKEEGGLGILVQLRQFLNDTADIAIKRKGIRLIFYKELFRALLYSTEFSNKMKNIDKSCPRC